MIVVILCCIFSKIKCLFTDIPNHKFYINEVQVKLMQRQDLSIYFYSLNLGSYS